MLPEKGDRMRKAYPKLSDRKRDVAMYLAFLGSSLGVMLVLSAVQLTGGSPRDRACGWRIASRLQPERMSATEDRPAWDLRQ
jgi:hypothetical protein